MKRPVSAGTILAGKYRLVSMLGRGGMGSVWRAERMGWQSPVAIKLMNAVDLSDVPALARFQREARLAASLRSIHVVQVLDDGVDPATGAPFIVMELLEGESLAERLQRVKRLRAPVVAQIVTQIARALARAHEAGLIHRDLKPDNILLTRNDEEELVKVLDFGIAKWLGAHQSSGTLAGQMLGTPAYMSPEHFANSANIDHRADLWGLGVIAFECIAGVRPFQGETLVSLALSVCNGRYTPASSFADVPDGFDAWFARACAQDPKRRFPSARAMADELRGLCGHIPMLWQDSNPPAEHATREKTELEPVLELTRRAKSSRAPDAKYPITAVDSVLPMLRSHSAPVHGNGLRWAVGVGSLLAFAATTVVAGPVLRPTAVEGIVARVRSMAHLDGPATTDTPAPAAASGAPLPAQQGSAVSPAAPPGSTAAAPGGAPGPADKGLAASSGAAALPTRVLPTRPTPRAERAGQASRRLRAAQGGRMLAVMIRCAVALLALCLSSLACSSPASPAATPASEPPASEPPSEPTAEPASSAAPHGKRAPCQSDQACNDDPSVSALWGRCTELGVCECNDGFERSPTSDLCRPIAR